MRKLLSLIFLLLPLMVSAQTAEVTLKGKVIDAADGYPLIGASVVVEGTKYGAITDVDGNFELKMPKVKCDIVFSCIGYDDEDRKSVV